jgi:peptide/nickel transport system substrate-binding protein
MRLSRRLLVAGAGAAAIGSRFRSVSAQDTSGTPVAITLPPAPDTIGQLTVVREARPTYASAPADSDQLRLLVQAGDNANFNPAAFAQDFQIMSSYLDPLVWIDDVTMEPLPWLAESWQVSEDGREVTYTLRGDVTWHDGDPLTADDVVFSFFVYRDDIHSAVRNFFTNLQNVEAVDDRTVKATLSAPDGNWLLNASSQLIFRQKQYQKFWNNQNEGERTLDGFNWKKTEPLGTGPWKVTKSGDDSVEFDRNEGYFGGAPHFKQLTIGWESDSEKRIAAWKAGETDLLWPVTSAEVQAASDTPGILYVANSATVAFAAFNFENPARDPSNFLSDIRIRQALNLAINRERYSQEIFSGFIQIDKAGTIAQPWLHDDSAANPGRDLEQAKSLLKEAGWTSSGAGAPMEDADGNPFDLSVIVRNDSKPELIAMLQSIVADFLEIGIGLRVRAVSPERFFAIWDSEREYDLIAYSYSLFPGFTDFDLYGTDWDIRSNSQGWNPGGYSNETVDGAIADALKAVAPDALKAALSTLQKTVNDDLFGLWFGFPQERILVRSDIQGFQPNIVWETWNTAKLWRQ